MNCTGRRRSVEALGRLGRGRRAPEDRARDRLATPCHHGPRAVLGGLPAVGLPGVLLPLVVVATLIQAARYLWCRALSRALAAVVQRAWQELLVLLWLPLTPWDEGLVGDPQQPQWSP